MMKRIFQFGIFLAAAISLFWPMLILAMDTAFGGLDAASFFSIAMFTSHIVVLLLLVVGAAALLNKRVVPKLLILGGPILACILLAVLAFGPFKDSAGRSLLILPSLTFSLAALVTGLLATQSSRGAQSCLR
jgi:hypothetical protein